MDFSPPVKWEGGLGLWFLPVWVLAHLPLILQHWRAGPLTKPSTHSQPLQACQKVKFFKGKKHHMFVGA